MRINSTLLLGALLLTTQAVSYAATETPHGKICTKYSTEKAELNQIYNEYSSLQKNRDNAERLFLLYQRLEQAAKHAQALYPADYSRNLDLYTAISGCLWDDKFSGLGLEVGHYSDRLEYSEKLMAEAHQLNPYTKYRSYTFYTEIFGERGANFGFPDVGKARSYLKEFPSGPYATKVNEILAGFYHDLYADLRAIEKEPNPEERDVTYDCYGDYLAKHPEEANLEHARKLSILYFERVIAATPLDDVKRPMYLDELNALKQGKTDNIVNVCGD